MHFIQPGAQPERSDALGLPWALLYAVPTRGARSAHLLPSRGEKKKARIGSCAAKEHIKTSSAVFKRPDLAPTPSGGVRAVAIDVEQGVTENSRKRRREERRRRHPWEKDRGGLRQKRLNKMKIMASANSSRLCGPLALLGDVVKIHGLRVLNPRPFCVSYEAGARRREARKTPNTPAEGSWPGACNGASLGGAEGRARAQRS